MLKKILMLLVSVLTMFALTVNVAFAAIPGLKSESISQDDEIVTFIVEVEGDALLASEEAAELGTDYLETDDAEAKETTLLKTQSQVLGKIQSKAKVSSGVKYTYTAVLNGFAIDAPKSKLDEIKAIDGVKNVVVAEPMEPDLGTSVGMTSSLPSQTADDIAETGYTGEGQVIAIIDSEFDVGHKFFSTAPSNPSLSKSDMADILEANEMNVDVSANQVYKSSKIPFAYDYVNNNADTYEGDSTFTHGSHVAGIVAGANGSVDAIDENYNDTEYTFSGVAPEAQLVLMKISLSNGALDESAAVAAIDDAVKIGVCAINMSLGMSYSSAASEPIFDTAFNNARNAGVMLCISEGNEGIGYNTSSAYTSEIDYSTSGVPATYSAATAVASANNSKNLKKLGTLTAADGTKCFYMNLFESSTFTQDFSGQTLEYVDCGYGSAEDFEGKDVSSKLALVSRGEATFGEKSENALEAGAIGLIIINLEDNPTNFINTVDLPLPGVEVDLSSGEYLKNAEIKTVYVSDESMVSLDASNAGTMSYFTSVGVDETLELKPEITAPGGSIYSSFPGDEFETLSGTSMAAPHMTGVTALMSEYLDKNGIDVSGEARVSLIENMLMSSADIMMQPENTEGEVVPYSPRIQGAGLVDTAAAMKTSSIFEGPDGKAKISLGDGIDDSFTLNFTVKNLTNTDVTYDDVSLDVTCDGYQTDENGDTYVVMDNAVSLTVLSTDAPESVTVPAGGETEVSINVTLDKTELEENSLVFTNGFFIDGFVTFASSNSDITTISLPFTGFRGDWTSQSIFDKTMYDDGGSVLYPYLSVGTYLYTEVDEDGEVSNYCLGEDCDGSSYSKENIAISPNGDSKGDTLSLILAPMRSTNDVTLTLTGADLDITHIEDGTKQKFDSADIDFSEIDELDETQLPDGEYTLTVSGVFNYDGAERESFELPITVDRVAPTVTGVSLDGDTLTVSASDNNYLYAVSIQYIDESGEEKTETVNPDTEKGGTCTAEFDISGLDTDDIEIYVLDTAMNIQDVSLSGTFGTVIANMTDYTSLDNMTAATVELYNTSENAISGDAIIAFYDEDGVLIATDIQAVSVGIGATAQCDFEMFVDTTDAVSVKLFIWDGVNEMCPIDMAKSFAL